MPGLELAYECLRCCNDRLLQDPFWREFAAVAPDGEKTASGTNPCDSSCAGLCWSELIQQHDLFTDAVKAKWATLCFTALVKKRQAQHVQIKSSQESDVLTCVYKSGCDHNKASRL